MTVRTQQFEELLQDIVNAASGPEREAPLDRLVHVIDAYVVSRRRQAVDQFKEMCRLKGLTAVRTEGFDQLVGDLDHMPDGDMAAHARHLVVDAFAVEEADLNTPEFTVKEDEDLDRLLNSTAALLSGHANQDVGMMWYDDLQVVLGRLRATVWHDASELPVDSTPVLAELKVSSKKKQRAFAVVSYHRTQKGLHDGEPEWFNPSTDDTCEVLRWQHIVAT